MIEKVLCFDFRNDDYGFKVEEIDIEEYKNKKNNLYLLINENKSSEYPTGGKVFENKQFKIKIPKNPYLKEINIVRYTREFWGFCSFKCFVLYKQYEDNTPNLDIFEILVECDKIIKENIINLFI